MGSLILTPLKPPPSRIVSADLPFDELTTGQQKDNKGSSSHEICYCVHFSNIIEDILPAHQPAPASVRILKDPSSLQRRVHVSITEKMCMLRDSVHLLIYSSKLFTVKFLFTSTKSGGLLIGVLNYLHLSFFLILIFQHFGFLIYLFCSQSCQWPRILF